MYVSSSTIKTNVGQEVREDTKVKVSFEKTIANYILLANFIGAIIFQKIGVPVGGTYLFFSFFLLALTCVVGICNKALNLNPGVLCLYLLFVFSFSMSQMLCDCEFSIMSVLLVIIAHAPYVLKLRIGQSTPGFELMIFRKIMTILAVCGVIQYFLQYLTGPSVPFFIDYNLPKLIEMPGFNKLNALEYGSSIFKSNGILFLEPSIFCQFLAVAIIIEVIYFRSIFRALLYLSGVLVTFSGTGIIILLTCLPLYLIAKKRILILLALCLCVISAPVWAPFVGLGKTVERASEITSTKSSAYARFVSPLVYIQNDQAGSLQGFLFGVGAGSLPWSADLSKDYQVFNPTWGKLFYEYGLLGTIFYIIFMGYVFISSKASFFLKFALFIQFVFLAEYLTPPISHLLILSFLVWPSKDGQEIVKNNSFNLSVSKTHA